MARLMLWFYDLLALIAIGPLCLLVRRHPNFQGTLPQRLGWKMPEAFTGAVYWFHAASLGEVKAVAGLIEALKARRPDCRIVLTSMTATGRQAALSVAAVDLVLPLPFDLPWVMRRYLQRLRPAALIVVETEIWPNMLIQARRAGVRTLFVNARMSAKAFGRYRRIRSLTAQVFAGAQVLAMAAADAQRFTALGAKRVQVLGNLKFDAVRSVDPAKAEALRQSLGCGERPVFIAGSVREGEEGLVMDAIIQARAQVPGLCALVAPRHPGSIPPIAERAQTAGISYGLRSQAAQGMDLLIIDTVGELFGLYGTAQAAFIGGSLVAMGGQNILEPMAWGVPTLHGPHMDNFTWAMEVVGEHAIMVPDAAALGKALAHILKDPETFAAKACAGQAALGAMQGITGRYVDAILG